MLNGMRTAFKAASAAGALPAFGWALLVVAVLCAGGAGYVVHRWDKGAQAIEQNKTLKTERDEANQAYDKLLLTATQREQQRVDDDIEQRRAIDRIDALANKLEQDHEANRKFVQEQGEDLAAMRDSRADLRDLRLGSDVLQHWNTSNAGAAAGRTTGPAAAPAGQPASAVPAATGSGERQRVRPAGQPRPGGGAVSRLQQPHRQPAGVDRRMAGDGMGLVLQRGGSTRPRRVGVPA